MDVNQVSTFLATGAILIGVGVVAIWVTRLVAIWFEPARSLFASLKASFAGYGLWLGGAMAVVAMAGSLYYSQIAHFPPCEYCWYQRIAMYPIGFLSALALWRRDLGLMWYFRLQATVGAAIGAYHYLTQILEFLDGGSCSATAPCTLKYVNQFGFVSIPFMAACCFVLIAVAAHYVVKFQGDNA